jgi:hypothetical protein
VNSLQDALAAAQATLASVDASDDQGFGEARRAVEAIGAALTSQARTNQARQEYQRRHGVEPTSIDDDAERQAVIAIGVGGASVYRIVDANVELLAHFGEAKAPAVDPRRAELTASLEAADVAEARRADPLRDLRGSLGSDFWHGRRR